MAKAKTWTVKVHRATHTVEVKRKPWLAIGEIKVDGKMVAMFPAKALSIGLFQKQQPFEIADQLYVLKIKPGMWNYNYELYLDGELIEPDMT